MKEIGYSTDSQAMEVEDDKSTQERGHSANSIHTSTNDEEWEEFEHVQALMEDVQDEESKCRFCWQAGASVDNPLLCTCSCKGTMTYIHLDCLKSWLNVKKQQKQSPNFNTYFWKAFECEICKRAYPLMIKTTHNG